MAPELRLRRVADSPAGKNPSAGHRDYPVADNLVIGRDPAADIVIDSPEVSRRHARLAIVDGVVFIEDLNSTNGIKVAGRTVPRSRLHAGQLLVLGDVTLQVVGDGMDEDATLIGAYLTEDSGSVVVDEPGDDSTTFRGGYALPPGWSREDYADIATDPAEHAADRQMLADLLRHRGVNAAEAKAALMTLDDPAGSRIFLLDAERGPVWTVGRSADAAVLLEHSTVSSRHAAISLAGDRWLIEDSGATNGTQVNGQRVQSGELNPGDILGFGRVRMVFDVVG